MWYAIVYFILNVFVLHMVSRHIPNSHLGLAVNRGSAHDQTILAALSVRSRSLAFSATSRFIVFGGSQILLPMAIPENLSHQEIGRKGIP
jgi:hypothetical protein